MIRNTFYSISVLLDSAQAVKYLTHSQLSGGNE